MTPTPTSTIMGGFTGSYITIEGSSQQKELILWSENGIKIDTVWKSPSDLTCGGYIRVNWSPKEEVISVEYWKNGGHLLLHQPDGTEIKTIYTGIDFCGGPNGQANWSPDGKWVAFSSKGDNTYTDIYRIDANGENLIQLINTYEKNGSPIFTPDGRYVIYRDEVDNLYIVESDGSNPRRLIFGPAAIIDWSPDGKQALYAKASPSDILLLVFETLDTIRLTFDGSNTYEGGERFSSDGKWIMFTGYGFPSAGNRFPKLGKNLFIMPVDGLQEPKLITVVKHARFSPDGTLIFFHGWLEGQDVTGVIPDYYAIQADGTGLIKIDDNGYGFVYGIWRP